MAARRGLYEQVISERFEEELRDLDAELIQRRELDLGEAADRLAMYLAYLVERSVGDLSEEERVQKGLALVRALIEVMSRELRDTNLRGDAPVQERTVLRAVLGRQPDGSPEPVTSPSIPLLDTTILTNSPGEPRLLHQLLTEIETAHRVDVVMAFIRRSGIRPFIEAFRRHCQRGRLLRIVTTTYTGSTECGALEQLQELGADVRVSYDTSSTRLHAKAWLFFRDEGISTAYVGSSNLTHSAQVSGLEWNIRASGARNRHLVDKIGAVFDAYWESGDFKTFDAVEFGSHSKQERSASAPLLSPVEIRLEPFQERLLEEIEVARERGHHRNLLVSATGTGKTVMAAVDYARLKTRLPRARLLFVAHRTEILQQSASTYRHALRDGSFGEFWVGGTKPQRWEHVFASIQTLSRRDLESLASDHFDVVVVDEFHHAAAKSYRDFLDHVRPRELLGLTATPERADDLPVLHYFGDRIAAELRLWDAIDQHRLVPFIYYGVHDNVDLTQVPWKRGHGYDVEGLTNLYTGDDAWARLVLKQLEIRVDDVNTIRALGFCVSVDHARFMARIFGELGVHSTAVWGDSPEEERREALGQLRRGEISVLFSVDLFNEGVDLPNVDTLLLLRPTDSPTLFLQQLGRGLRRSDGKQTCLVLDFVGQHRREFRFDRRLGALLGGSRRNVERQVEDGFPFLPAGCHMEMDSKAREIVLESIRRAIPSRWPAKVDELRKLRGEGRAGSLLKYLEDSGLDLGDVYDGRKSWSELQEDAGGRVHPAGPVEGLLRRACGRLLHVDDSERLDGYRELLRTHQRPSLPAPATRASRLVRMLLASLLSGANDRDASVEEGLSLLWEHPQVRAELIELFDVLAERLDHQHFRLEEHPEVPLQVHARYTKLEILAAFSGANRAKAPPWQTGVLWVPEEKADLLAFTLDKSSGQFSPTTRYRDYAISSELIHWESQSVTRADSQTGLRYRNHVHQGSSVMLFARLRQDERAFWFLGPATYVSHLGERPMAVTWRLKYRLPGDLFASFAAAVA